MRRIILTLLLAANTALLVDLLFIWGCSYFARDQLAWGYQSTTTVRFSAGNVEITHTPDRGPGAFRHTTDGQFWGGLGSQLGWVLGGLTFFGWAGDVDRFLVAFPLWFPTLLASIAPAVAFWRYRRRRRLARRTGFTPTMSAAPRAEPAPLPRTTR